MAPSTAKSTRLGVLPETAACQVTLPATVSPPAGDSVLIVSCAWGLLVLRRFLRFLRLWCFRLCSFCRSRPVAPRLSVFPDGAVAAEALAAQSARTIVATTRQRNAW